MCFCAKTKLGCSVLGWRTIWWNNNLDTESPHYRTAGFLLAFLTSLFSLHSVWAATDISEELKPESRFESEIGSHTVSPAISNSSVSIGLDSFSSVSVPHATSLFSMPWKPAKPNLHYPGNLHFMCLTSKKSNSVINISSHFSLWCPLHVTKTPYSIL